MHPHPILLPMHRPLVLSKASQLQFRTYPQAPTRLRHTLKKMVCLAIQTSAPNHRLAPIQARPQQTLQALAQTPLKGSWINRKNNPKTLGFHPLASKKLAPTLLHSATHVLVGAVAAARSEKRHAVGFSNVGALHQHIQS